MTSQHPDKLLLQRQDESPPGTTSIEVPGLGTLRGYIWPNGVQQFFSIPYGTFKKNWTRSTLVDSWPNDKHDGTKLGPWGMQPVPWAYVAGHSSVPVKPYSYLNDPDENDNHNCLTINLTIPPSASGEVPVLTFIHGGAFIFGSSHFPIYDGYRLVSESVRKGKPVVYASFNYRLGITGFLASKDIALDLEADGFHGNGNFGLTDQQLALEWIQKNISKLGGDKNNVTIFGESAGGMSVAAHIASRRGPELFQRGAQLSGGLNAFESFNEAEHEIFYERVLKAFDIPINAPDRLKQLQAISDARIVASTPHIFTTLISVPSLCNDGWFFAEGREHGALNITNPPDWLQSFMTSETYDEGVVFRDELWLEDVESIKAHLRRYLEPKAVERVIGLYGLYDDITHSDKMRIAEELCGDVLFRNPNIMQGDLIITKECKVPSYFYHWDQQCSFPDSIYRNEAYHAMDLLSIFLTKYEAMTPEERPIADAMHTAFLTFAYGGEPWEPYNKGRRWQVWGPHGRMGLLTEEEDEPIRRYKRARDVCSQDWYRGFFLGVQDLAIKRFRLTQSAHE
ncbi:triacylglycerol lipase V precursor [Fusarium pseudocircinatum]|uniref:Triacylglycerol lipase V n=1 Tax=Fusarium pseudocircinatum TaxID=56676 RepID=A0A8H5UV00_9HYPO|nr:triacylglycerol lipase V precursor [Fusarium pseudocircinatum]